MPFIATWCEFIQKIYDLYYYETTRNSYRNNLDVVQIHIHTLYMHVFWSIVSRHQEIRHDAKHVYATTFYIYAFP